MNALVTAHDVTPEAALAAVRAHEGPLLLDLDETLYLRNSTEDYLDSLRPRLPALLLMRLLDALRPWRWTGGEVTRDVWRVRLAAACFPWSLWRWRRCARAMAADFRNTGLLDALRESSAEPIVATVGFPKIVRPLVAALGLADAPIVAAASFSDRRRGKYCLAADALGKDLIERALVLTDSPQDLPLLEACARPLRTVWPTAQYRQALSNVYVPGQYLSRVKRPGQRYIVRAILQEDFALWVLCSIAMAAYPLAHVAGLAFLLLSFWAIYERGYVDNDLMAARFEHDPKLSAEFHRAPVPTPRWQPWLWAAGSGAIALALLRWPGPPQLLDFGIWSGVLLATHGWFLLYNRCDKRTRIWLFPGLQFARAAAFATVVPIGMLGAVALGAHVLAKWVPYYIYRLAGRDWVEVPFHLTRLVFFAVLALLVAFGHHSIAITSKATALALLAWMLFRARNELKAALRAARRIDRSAAAIPHEAAEAEPKESTP